MLKTRLSSVLALCLVLGAGPASAQSLALLQGLGGLGISPAQAIGGTQALLGLAKTNLPAEEFSQLLGGAPELGQVMEMTSAASAMGAMAGMGAASSEEPATEGEEMTVTMPEGMDLSALTGNADLISQFADLGMDAGMIAKFAPTLLDLVGKAGGPSTMGLLTKGLGIL
jgi:hypothetical protein